MGDELQIRVPVKLDISKIKNDIPEIQKTLNTSDEYKLKLQTNIDIKSSLTNIKSQIAEMQKQLNLNLNIGTNGNAVSGITGITNSLKDVQTQATQTAQSVEKIYTVLESDITDTIKIPERLSGEFTILSSVMQSFFRKFKSEATDGTLETSMKNLRAFITGGGYQYSGHSYVKEYKKDAESLKNVLIELNDLTGGKGVSFVPDTGKLSINSKELTQFTDNIKYANTNATMLSEALSELGVKSSDGVFTVLSSDIRNIVQKFPELDSYLKTISNDYLSWNSNLQDLAINQEQVNQAIKESSSSVKEFRKEFEIPDKLAISNEQFNQTVTDLGAKAKLAFSTKHIAEYNQAMLQLLDLAKRYTKSYNEIHSKESRAAADAIGLGDAYDKGLTIGSKAAKAHVADLELIKGQYNDVVHVGRTAKTQLDQIVQDSELVASRFFGSGATGHELADFEEVVATISSLRNMSGMSGNMFSLESNIYGNHGTTDVQAQNMINNIFKIDQAVTQTESDLKNLGNTLNSEMQQSVTPIQNIVNLEQRLNEEVVTMTNSLGEQFTRINGTWYDSGSWMLVGEDAEKLNQELQKIVQSQSQVNQALEQTAQATQSVTNAEQNMANANNAESQSAQNVVQATNQVVQGLVSLQGQSQNVSKSLSGTFENIHLDVANSEINKLASELKSLGLSDDYIKNVITRLNNLDITILKTSSSFTTFMTKEEELKQGLSNIKITGLDSIGNVVNYIERFDAETGNFVNATTTINEQLSKVVQAEKDATKNAEELQKVFLNFKTVSGAFNALQKQFSTVTDRNISGQLSDVQSLIQVYQSLKDANAPLLEQKLALEDIKNAFKSVMVDVNAYKQSLKNVGAESKELKSTLDFLSKQNQKISTIDSKTLRQANPLKEGTEYFTNYENKLNEVKNKIAEITENNVILSNEHKRLIGSMVTDLQNYAIEQQQLAYPPMISSTDVASQVKNATSQLEKLKLQWQEQGVIVGSFDEKVKQLSKDLSDVGNDSTALKKYQSELVSVKSEASTLKILHTIFDNLTKSLENQDLYVGNLKNSLEALGNSFNTIQFGEGFGDWVSNFISSFDKIKSDADEVTKAFSEWANAQNRVYEIQTEIAKTNSVTQQPKYDSLVQELTKAQQELENVRASSQRWLNDSIPQEQQQEYIIQQTSETLKKLKEALLVSQGKVDLGLKDVPNDISKIEGKLNSLKTIPAELRTQLKQIKTAFNSIDKMDTSTSNGVQAKKVAYDQLIQSINDLNRAYEAKKQQENKDSGMQKQAANAEILSQRYKKLIADIQTLQNANSKAMKSNKTLSSGMTFQQETNALMQQLANSSNLTQKELQKVQSRVATVKSEIKAMGIAGTNWLNSIATAAKKFGNWMGVTTLISRFFMEIRKGIVEIKNLDTELTEISKTAGVARESLDELGMAAYDAASKYGRTVSDYLSGVKEMTRAGFEGQSSQDMAELSLRAQAAGDMTAELANEFIVASNAAYQLNGNITELNKVIDGTNYISNKNATNMTELANGMKVAGSQAAISGVSVDKLSSAIGTMIATTQQGGETAGRAFKGKRDLITNALYGYESIVA